MTGHFYVYEHWRPDRAECFYVGKGSGDRAFSMRQRNRHHRAVVKKLLGAELTVEVRIVANNLDEDSAHAIEMKLISEYGRRVEGGSLVNLTAGGEGTAGHRHDPDTIARIKAKLIGQKRTPEQCERIAEGQRGKKLSDEHKANIGAAGLGHRPYPKTPEGLAKIGAMNRGKKLSAERKAKISEFLKSRPVSEETRAKHSARMKGNRNFEGRRHTPETLAKMSISSRRAHAKRKALQG